VLLLPRRSRGRAIPVTAVSGWIEPGSEGASADGRVELDREALVAGDVLAQRLVLVLEL
jgi:hypothetical protein